MKHLRTVPILALLLLIGCGTSASYKYTVKNAYPLVADKLDDYTNDVDSKLLADGLRAAATDPISYEVASDAWEKAGANFRVDVMADTETPEFTRGKWLMEADKLDELNAREASRRAFFFLPP